MNKQLNSLSYLIYLRSSSFRLSYNGIIIIPAKAHAYIISKHSILFSENKHTLILSYNYVNFYAKCITRYPK